MDSNLKLNTFFRVPRHKIPPPSWGRGSGGGVIGSGGGVIKSLLSPSLLGEGVRGWGHWLRGWGHQVITFPLPLGGGGQGVGSLAQGVGSSIITSPSLLGEGVRGWGHWLRGWGLISLHALHFALEVMGVGSLAQRVGSLNKKKTTQKILQMER